MGDIELLAYLFTYISLLYLQIKVKRAHIFYAFYNYIIYAALQKTVYGAHIIYCNR